MARWSNLEGQVIGINSAINTGGNGNGSVGLGFAIPINLVNNVATQILDGKTVEHAQIGVQVRNATGDDQVTDDRRRDRRGRRGQRRRQGRPEGR